MGIKQGKPCVQGGDKAVDNFKEQWVTSVA